MPKLDNPMWEKFCLEMATCNNATEAYIKAGNKVKDRRSAGACGRKLLRNSTIQARLTELGKLTNTPKVLSIQQRKELLTQFATDTETAKTDRIKAVDLLNKMDSVYLQRQEISIDKPIVITDNVQS